LINIISYQSIAKLSWAIPAKRLLTLLTRKWYFRELVKNPKFTANSCIARWRKITKNVKEQKRTIEEHVPKVKHVGRLLHFLGKTPDMNAFWLASNRPQV
jgi:hypothetical protein